MTVTNEAGAPQQHQKVLMFNYTESVWTGEGVIDEVVSKEKKNSWYVWLKSGRAIVIERNPDADGPLWREVNMSTR